MLMMGVVVRVGFEMVIDGWRGGGGGGGQGHNDDGWGGGVDSGEGDENEGLIVELMLERMMTMVIMAVCYWRW